MTPLGFGWNLMLNPRYSDFSKYCNDRGCVRLAGGWTSLKGGVIQSDCF